MLLRFEEIGEHKHRTVKQSRKQPNNGQESDESRHGGLRPGFVPYWAAVLRARCQGCLEGINCAFINLSELQSEQPVTVEPASALAKSAARAVKNALGTKSIVLTGMMGSGKSSIGRRLALALDLPFNDADTAIEQAAGMPVEDIFRVHGEPYFREGEERVIRRLLQTGPQVLATGGGAVLSAKTRAEIARNGVS